MELSDYIETFSYDVAFWLGGVKSTDTPVEDLGSLSLEVSGKLRVAGIIVLLIRASSDGFYHNLIRSGGAWETYLRRIHAEKKLDDHHFCSGRYEPLVDAVAAGDLDLARRIARLSPDDFRPDHEYEDDYCYARVLHRLLEPLPDETAIAPLLARFEKYLDSEASPRFDLCRALTARDQALFDSSFEDLLLLHESDEINEEAQEPDAVALRQVFVEGLAILRLAELRGLQTEPDYRFCPSLARVPMVLPFPGE